MKDLKIRFIERYSVLRGEINGYLIQKKTLFGWVDITYTIFMGYGSITQSYNNKNKHDLLNDVLRLHYETCIDFVNITEYPSIKIYEN